MVPGARSAIELPSGRSVQTTHQRLNHHTMLFLTYWKLNEGLSVRETNEIATTLTRKGLFPPEGTEILRWDATPDGWGIVLWEADEYAAVNNGLAMWRAAADDEAFFEKTVTAPASPVEEVIPETAALLEELE